MEWKSVINMACQSHLLTTYITENIVKIRGHECDPEEECPFYFTEARLEGDRINLILDESALDNLPKSVALEEYFQSHDGFGRPKEQ